MKILVGLGNPGKKYVNNRHNVGHMFVDYLVKELTGLRVNGLKLVKTDCFMNRSGIFVKKLIENWKPVYQNLRSVQGPEPIFDLVHGLEIRNLIVIHDDLDIPFGKFHIQFAVGPQLHNGLESIENHLKTKDFWRVRIGVDNRPARRSLDEGGLPDKKVPSETYTLQNFLSQEKKLLETEIFPKIFSQLKLNFKML